MTASALRAGAGLAHGLMAMKMYDEGVRVPVHSH
jgi:hypothetical protein